MSIRPLTDIKSINRLQQQPLTAEDFKPRITVMGVGGAGSNAVNNMIRSKLEGVEFVVCNTDAQALGLALTENRIQLGLAITQGLGAGSRPQVGEAAAEESMDDILNYIQGTNMLFITAGMGGGTGTGAAPVIAKMAKDMGILTVGVVTKPFHFEGAHRTKTAEAGIEELQGHVDTLIVIPNQNLFRIANEKTTFADAFKMADEVLYSGVRSVTDLMIVPGLINLDFADIRTVMTEMGKAMMGTGEAEGDNRAIQAAEAAIANPLLDEVSMKGAKGVLISVTGGMDMTLFEVDEAANLIRDQVEVDANIIFGSTFDEKLNGRIRVSVVATGIDQNNIHQLTQKAVVEQPVAATPPAQQEALTNAHEEVLAMSNDVEASAPEEDIYVRMNDFSAPQQAADNRYTSLKQEMEMDSDFRPASIERPRKLSFFERITESLTGRSSESENETAVASKAESQEFSSRLRIRPTEPGTESVAEIEEDISEIPAYLRRQGK
ncbi:MAG: cell division protein FtsZ [Alphaproteobacteria bacterium]|nr:cell division protein FtsZ [Alphaproteobacteria bacterium]